MRITINYQKSLKMNINDVRSSSCKLFEEAKFTECCELLQRTIDDCHLKTIAVTDEIEFITLRNNLLVSNCLVGTFYNYKLNFLNFFFHPLLF